MNEKSPTNGRGPGRPPISVLEVLPGFDITRGDVVLRALTSGHTIHDAAKAAGISVDVVARWRLENDDFASSFARALETYHDIKGDTLLTAHEDIEDPQRARLYSDNVKWLLSKRDKRYADRLDVTVENRVNLADALQEAAARVLSTTYQDITPSANDSIESIAYETGPTDCVSDSTDDELDSLLS